MDTGILDKDGDEDIILSSFTYGIGTAPQEMTENWNESTVDLLFLKNKLNNN